jgi:CBS domain-containing protein
MKVKDIMTAQPLTCAPDTNLAAAAALMLDADCGILPVTQDGKLVGIVTDRDMYIALATRNKLASQVTAGEVARKQVFTVRAGRRCTDGVSDHETTPRSAVAC